MGGHDPIAHARTVREERAARRAAAGHVLDAFARVGATRKLPIRGADPTRAQRPSTRLHGATRHGQRRAAFDQRAALRAETTRRRAAGSRLPIEELTALSTMGHKRMPEGALENLIADAAPTTLPELIGRSG